VLSAGFVIVKVSVRVGLDEKALSICGGSITVKVAVAVFPVPPFVELIAPVVLR
jgi:hypothetical protein